MLTLSPATEIGLWVFAALWGGAIIAGQWGLPVKAGKPGWPALVVGPGGRPGWPARVPYFGAIQLVRICHSRNKFARSVFGVAHAFGRSSAFGIGLASLPAVFFPLLVFGPARYASPVDRTDFGLLWNRPYSGDPAPLHGPWRRIVSPRPGPPLEAPS